MLKCLDGRQGYFSDSTCRALRLLPNLETLRIGNFSPLGLHEIVQSRSLRSLTIEGVFNDEHEALATLVDNRVLTSLTLSWLKDDRSLLTLARNVRLISLDVELTSEAAAGMKHLAEIPTLQTLRLGAIAARIVLTTDNVRALCQRPFDSLSLVGWEVSDQAGEWIGKAKTTRLSLDNCANLTMAIARALASNPFLVYLSLKGEVMSEEGALILAASPTLEYLNIHLSSDRPVTTKARMRRAWRVAGELSARLELLAYPIVNDVAGEALTGPW